MPGRGPVVPQELQQLAQAVGRQADEPTMRAVIRKLCAWHPLRAEELGRRVNRNADYLKTRYLKSMVAEGELALTIPEMPKHPNQAYRTPEEEQ